jgi:hypothetical protein
MDMRATNEVLLETVLYTRSGYKEDNWGNQVSSVRECVKLGRPPFIEDLSTEAEEWPLSEAVTGKRLLKIPQNGKGLACAGVICKVWTSVIVL